MIGTIEATIDGEPKTWRLIEHEVDAFHSALWIPMADQTRVTLGGYESLDITFEAGTPPKVSAPGTMLILTFAAPESGEASYAIGDGTTEAEIVLLLRVGDFGSTHRAEAGALAITSLDLGTGGSATGTFNGRLVGMGEPETALEVTDGRFQVSGIRKLELD